MDLIPKSPLSRCLYLATIKSKKVVGPRPKKKKDRERSRMEESLKNQVEELEKYMQEEIRWSIILEALLRLSFNPVSRLEKSDGEGEFETGIGTCKRARSDLSSLGPRKKAKLIAELEDD